MLFDFALSITSTKTFSFSDALELPTPTVPPPPGTRTPSPVRASPSPLRPSARGNESTASGVAPASVATSDAPPVIDEIAVQATTTSGEIVLPDSPRRVPGLEAEIASPRRQPAASGASRPAAPKAIPEKWPTASSGPAEQIPKSRGKTSGQKTSSAPPAAAPTSPSQDLVLRPGKFSSLPPPPAEIPTAALRMLRATVSSFASSGSRDLAATRAAGSSGIRVVDDFNKAWLAADASETAGDLHAAGPSRSAQALHALQVAALDVTRISEVNFSSFIQNTLVLSITTSPRDWCLVL